MLDSGGMTRSAESGCSRYTVVAVSTFTRDNSNKTNPTTRAKQPFQTAALMKESGLKARLMDLESSTTEREPFTKAIGLGTCRMAKG